MSLESLRKRLKAKIAEAKRDGAGGLEVEVGYSIYYAIYVHWNLEAVHPNGEALFLTKPYHKLVRRAGKIVAQKMRLGMTMEEAIISMAQDLKDESRTLVPVQTGELWASAFVRVNGEDV